FSNGLYKGVDLSWFSLSGLKEQVRCEGLCDWGLGILTGRGHMRRYKKLLCSVDLTKDFFFSYSYNVMFSIQRNLNDHNTTGQSLYETRFVWNEFLTRGVRNNLQNASWTGVTSREKSTTKQDGFERKEAEFQAQRGVFGCRFEGCSEPLASQEQSYAKETLTRKKEETKAKSMEFEIGRLQKKLEERNEQLQASASSAEKISIGLFFLTFYNYNTTSSFFPSLQILPLVLVGIIMMQNCVFTGISYNSHTLGSAMSNLTPTITFLLAIIF
ncbi:hypothetical protein S83_004861, partial [Arachis hypogaea]